ncbi:MAG: hypothetical protein V1893_03330 [Candidatus Omnitrophota bacterium]
MKYVVVFYSRTGVTRKVAHTIAGILKCDCEEIVDTKDRSGVIGYVKSGTDAASKKLTVIKNPQKDPGLYDLVILGTPVWAFTMTPAMRTYIIQHKEKFKLVAFFCTQGGAGGKKTFKDMEALCGKKPIGMLILKTAEVLHGEYIKIRGFVNAIYSG